MLAHLAAWEGMATGWVRASLMGTPVVRFAPGFVLGEGDDDATVDATIDALNERVYAGLGLIAESLLPPGLAGYDPALRGLSYDPERARDLMRQAGHGDGFEIEYRTWDTDEFNNSGLLALLIEDLETIGIRVRISRHSAGVWSR